MRRACAVIPAYNESRHLGEVLRGLEPHVGARLVIDDGSTDDTAARARAAGAEVIRHAANRGKGASLREAFDHCLAAGYEAVLTLDGDGQHRPGEAPRLLDALDTADLVVGSRMGGRSGMPRVRWWTNRVMSAVVSSMAGVRIEDSQCGFRALRLAAWERMVVRSSNYDFESEMLVAAGRAGLRIAAVPVTTVYGDETSSIRPVTDTIRFLQLVGRLGLWPPAPSGRR